MPNAIHLKHIQELEEQVKSFDVKLEQIEEEYHKKVERFSLHFMQLLEEQRAEILRLQKLVDNEQYRRAKALRELRSE